jgi:hypothetical protein
VLYASRSSSRCEQMRSTREETMSADARYNSMSCTPAANASSVGARPAVMLDSLDETVDGVVGGRIEDELEDSPSDRVGGLRDLNMAC